MSPGRAVLWPTALATLLAGCSLFAGNVRGREPCWPEGDLRTASIWRGVFRMDDRGPRLETPEGLVIQLIEGRVAPRAPTHGDGMLFRDHDIVAESGDVVTLFGGAGADGSLVICQIDENESRPIDSRSAVRPG